MKSAGFVIKTLGCKSNYCDSISIRCSLEQAGFIHVAGGQADFCVINGCSVTAEAEKEVLRTARRLLRENPGAFTVLAGCTAELMSVGGQKPSGIDLMVANRERHHIARIIAEHIQKTSAMPAANKNITSWPGAIESCPAPHGDSSTSARTRMFLKIQEGCGNSCAYCVVCRARGPARSISIDEVVCRITKAVSCGCREIVLTATNLGEYGKDWNSGHGGLELLVSGILNDTSLERLRLSSLGPMDVSEQLLQIMEDNSRLCPHLHVSLQSPVSKVLARMKRPYDTGGVEKLLSRIDCIRPPGTSRVHVVMDVITGFPGETEADFREGLLILDRMPWGRLHVFPYSDRSGTPASMMKDKVCMNLVRERSGQLRNLSLKRLQSIHARLLESPDPGLDGLLIESAAKKAPGWMWARSTGYLRAMIPGISAADKNSIFSARMSSYRSCSRTGEVWFIASSARKTS
ncbi:MAG: hypothetical protein A2583_16305 [Bdellovibrionales bacterium RIFOXYD1_FULL_53_11]|nr:MAG: hypothetical protein A2583_16305 [Bdellovibrionales bacterium RIFOXYD1_FULL_53_11]